jgi:two-component system, cell cycle response regulator
MKKILTIDDSKTLRMIVGKHLRPFGVEILEAENGQVGVTVAQKEKPDLILLDYNMPVLDGYHTLVELKTDPGTKPIPVMMLTTETVKETVFKLIKLGLKDYIAKPFTREVLLAKVNPVLALYAGENPPTEAELQAATAAKTGPAKTKVLAVDHNEELLGVLRGFIADRFEFETETNSLAAMKKITSGHHDWLFLNLTLPNNGTAEIFETFMLTHKKSMRGKRVVGMALRTALREILDFKAKGILEFLLIPFSKEEVIKLVEKPMQPNGFYMADEVEEGYLTRHSNARILLCPEGGDPSFPNFVQSLSTDVIKEIKTMAESGQGNLVIQVSAGIISGVAIVRRFHNLIYDVQALGMNMKFVSEAEKVREFLAQSSETKGIPVYGSLNAALEAIEPAPVTSGS